MNSTTRRTWTWKRLVLLSGISFWMMTHNLTGTLYEASAQSCTPQSNVSFVWTSPPNIDVLSGESARWPIDAGIRFSFIGEWCPIPEDITFTDDQGNEVPATLFFNMATQLVENGPDVPQVALLKPLMSLEISTDYTLTLSPPNPALATFENYQLTFRTARGPMEGDYQDFAGIDNVEIDGDLCEGEGLVLSDPENSTCTIPSYLQLSVSFLPLPRPEVTYLIYRTSSRPNGSDASVDLVDEVERPLAYLRGVNEERAARPIEARFNVLYAPFPREECFKVVALDEWGRERAGDESIKCVNLGIPSACSDVQFPAPNPFENTPPIEGRACEAIGIHGATGRTAVPPIPTDNEMDDDEEMDDEEMDDEGMMNDDEGTDEGCSQGSRTTPLSLLFFFILWSMQRVRRARA